MPGTHTLRLAMYLRMGFVFRHETPTIAGVPYGLYVKPLDVG